MARSCRSPSSCRVGACTSTVLLRRVLVVPPREGLTDDSETVGFVLGRLERRAGRGGAVLLGPRVGVRAPEEGTDASMASKMSTMGVLDGCLRAEEPKIESVDQPEGVEGIEKSSGESRSFLVGEFACDAELIGSMIDSCNQVSTLEAVDSLRQ